MLTEPIRVTLAVVDVLDTQNIPYFIGGSMATAIHGVVHAKKFYYGQKPGRLLVQNTRQESLVADKDHHLRA